MMLAAPPRDLSSLFDPARVAVIGASADRARPGGVIAQELARRFAGEVWGVNPRLPAIEGLSRMVGRVEDLPDGIDLAIVATNALTVADQLRACAARGVRSAVVLAGGFAERGSAGADLQVTVAAVARDAGMAVLGPNCIGLVNVRTGLWATFREMDRSLPAGPVAIISQSGARGTSLCTHCQGVGVACGYVVTTGNEADVTAAAVLESLVLREDVEVVALVLEGVRDAATLVRACATALRLGKPVVALKLGRTPSGRQAALTHTASLAGDDPVLDAVFDRLGVVRAGTDRELLDLLSGFRVGRLPRGRRLGIATSSGAWGVMAADEGDAVGLEVPPLDDVTAGALERLVPDIATVRNPLDYTPEGLVDEKRLAAVVTTFIGSSVIDGVVANGGRAEQVGAFGEAARHCDKPIIAWADDPRQRRRLAEVSIASAPEPAPAVRLLDALRRYQQDRPLRLALAVECPLSVPSPVAGPPPRVQSMDDTPALELMARYRIPICPTRLVRTRDEAVQAAVDIGFPVALKLGSAVADHKSEIGGVALHLQGPAEVASAFDAMGARATACCLVQAMVQGGAELLIGAVRDPTFGPVIAVGMGGVHAEIIQERALGLAPLDYAWASRMVETLCGGRLVHHPRGIGRRGAARVAAVVVAVSQLVVAEPAVYSLDINPLIVKDDGVTAVDVLVQLDHQYSTLRDGAMSTTDAKEQFQ